MARQKSEDRTVPKSRRKSVSTRGLNPSGGGKAVPVNEQTGQLGMRFGTAEILPARAGRPDGVADMGRPVPATRAVPKPKRKKKAATSATMEDSAGGQASHRVAQRLRGAQVPVGVEPRAGGRPRTPQRVFRRAGARFAHGAVGGTRPAHRRPGAAQAAAGIGEVVNRPAAGVATRRPEEPDVNSTCPVL